MYARIHRSSGRKLNIIVQKIVCCAARQCIGLFVCKMDAAGNGTKYFVGLQ